MFRSKRTSRSVDYLLSALSPLEVSRATRAYLATLSEKDLQGLIERSCARMDDDERAYLAMSPDFATFLEQNRRSLRTLDRDSLRAILMPVIVGRAASVEGTEDESTRADELSSALRAALPPLSAGEAWSRLTRPSIEWTHRSWNHSRERLNAADAALTRAYRRIWHVGIRVLAGVATACAVVAAGAAIALLLVSIVVPAGRATVGWFQTHPLPHIALARPASHTAVAQHIVATSHPSARKTVVAQRTAPPPKPKLATPKPATPKPATPAPATPKPATPKPRVTATPAPVHIAASKPRPRQPVRLASRSVEHATALVGTLPTHDPALVQRARLIVMSYLDSLMRGDASSALGNLGLSASAGTSNLTEAPILAGATEFKIVRASQADASNAKVQVVIDSPQGRFFGDYIVSANGPAAWITQHEVIPVESSVARHY